MNRLYLLCILITFILSSLHAATPKVLSLNKFVKYSLKNHPVVKMNHSNYMASVLKTEATDSIYESNLFLNTYYTKGSLNPFTNSFNDNNSSLNSSVGLSKTFPKYGTQLTASASYAKQLNNGSIPTGDTPINFSRCLYEERLH